MLRLKLFSVVRTPTLVIAIPSNSRAGGSQTGEPNTYFDSGRYELTYLAADSKPEDVYRVIIQGTEWGSPNQFKFEPSDLWLKYRFPTPVHDGFGIPW